MFLKDLWDTAFGPLDEYDTLGDRYVDWIMLIIFTVVTIFFLWVMLGLLLCYPIDFFIVMLVLGGIIAPPLVAHWRQK